MKPYVLVTASVLTLCSLGAVIFEFLPRKVSAKPDAEVLLNISRHLNNYAISQSVEYDRPHTVELIVRGGLLTKARIADNVRILDESGRVFRELAVQDGEITETVFDYWSNNDWRKMTEHHLLLKHGKCRYWIPSQGLEVTMQYEDNEPVGFIQCHSNGVLFAELRVINAYDTRLVMIDESMRTTFDWLDRNILPINVKP